MQVDTLGLLAGHLLGDYVFQNDWMAQGKKRSSTICAVHCLIYTSCVCLCGQIGSWCPGDNRGQIWLFLAAIGIPHFLIDRWGVVKWWMNFYGQTAFAQPPMAPWSMIAVENVQAHPVVTKLAEGPIGDWLAAIDDQVWCGEEDRIGRRGARSRRWGAAACPSPGSVGRCCWHG